MRVLFLCLLLSFAAHADIRLLAIGVGTAAGPSCAEDAARFAEAVQQDTVTPVSAVVLRQPDRATFLHQLEDVCKSCRKEDTLVVLYLGDQGVGETTPWLLADGGAKVGLPEVATLLDGCRASAVVCLLDVPGLPRRPLQGWAFPRLGRQSLTVESCAANQQPTGGLFVDVLIEAWKTAADDQGRLTANALVGMVQAKMGTLSKGRQTPRLAVDGQPGAELVLAVRKPSRSQP